MVSKSVALTFAVAACYAMLVCKVQSQGLFPANNQEKQICLDNANGRQLESATKNQLRACQVHCKYDDGNTETFNFPDGQLCCPFGVIPTGCCKDGSCAVGQCDMGSIFG